MSKHLRAIGFWFAESFPSALPRPEALASFAWDRAEKAAVLRHLREGHLFETYRGYSFCRFRCGADRHLIGHREYTDGVWVWPEGLPHYVEAHDVELPRSFIKRATGPRPANAPSTPLPVSLDWWTQWGRRRGAQIDLCDPWQAVSGWEEAQGLLRQLERELSVGHVLDGKTLRPVGRRVDCDDVLFIIEADPRLAVVHLTWSSTRERDPRWPSTAFVDGWAAWNAYRSEHP